MARLGLSAREFAALAAGLPKSGIAWRAVISHLACADTPRSSAQQPAANPFRRRGAADAPVCQRASPPLPASFSAQPIISIWCGRGPRCTAPIRSPAVPIRSGKWFAYQAKFCRFVKLTGESRFGYGAAHVMKTAGRAATVAVGYADGWLRSLSHRGCGLYCRKARSSPGPGVDGSRHIRCLGRRSGPGTSRRDDRTARRALRGR